MPMCGWCGSVVSAEAVLELQNGPTVLRLCPTCTESEQGRKMANALPRHTPRPVDEDLLEEDERPLPSWRVVTTLVLLMVLVLPLMMWFFTRP